MPFTAAAKAGSLMTACRRHKCLLHPAAGYSNYGTALNLWWSCRVWRFFDDILWVVMFLRVLCG